MGEPVRVVVVEDQGLVREALVALLQLQGPAVEVVGQAGGGREGLVVIETTRPDVALLDIQMPDGDGIAAAHAISRECPATRCLLLTTFAKDAYLTRGLEAGARGYVLKDAPVGELVDAILAVAQGRLWISPAMQTRWASALRESPLTDREQQILRLAATGMTNRQIAEHLFLVEGSVKNLWTELLQKLQARNRVEAIAIARSRGVID